MPPVDEHFVTMMGIGPFRAQLPIAGCTLPFVHPNKTIQNPSEEATLKKFIKLTLAAAVTAVALGGIASGVAQAQDMKFWRIGTGAAGGTYFPIGGLLANALSNPPGSRPCDKGGSCGVPGLVAIAVSTNATVANINSIQAGQLDAGLAGGQNVVQAFKGEGAFVDNKKEKIRAIANLFPEDLHLVLPKGQTMTSLKDLQGKRVGIAQAGSGTQVVVKMILEHYGVEVQAAELNNTQSAQRIADGQLDAYFYAMGTPASALVQLGSTKGFELYKFPEKERKEINDFIPFYVESSIPAGTYENVTYDVPTLAVNAQLITSIDQPEELVYEITKALWNDSTRKLLDNGHAKGKVIIEANALKGILIPLHPGAERYYKETGLLK
ncbi:MAG: TAXI family TRAP transporter solute-binding subunit [Oceanibaculum nanhaiense]|uniref:TAXI family TRAP transporter solute-binding subunit n=1 Tax=Oceanibaculum nanhaiense TaxID=1909734 RepID=UPI0025A44B82|nr:TAXI family TRAP transporter solute-binding subunit [Oceanibaculum nanhaiense]MDM7948010.1 TAXI family TRAP transporter solute-binding subunit [Oceanibaculum nanhaiense]